MADRGSVWSESETRTILEIWSEREIQRQLQAVVRNDVVFVKIAEELAKRGYQQTVAQCRGEIKALKNRYGRRKKYVSISKRTSLENFEVRRYFVRSLGLLRTEFGATSYEVWGYFIRSLGLFHLKFGDTSYKVRRYFIRMSKHRRVNPKSFAPGSATSPRF